MWNDGGKRRAWRGLIFFVGLMLAIAAYWGMSRCSLGSGLAEAATLAVTPSTTTPSPGTVHSGPAHIRSHATHRHRTASHHSSRRRRSSKPSAETHVTPPQPADSDNLKDVTSANSLGPAVVTILAGDVDGTSAHIAADIAAVLDSDDLRVMTVLGRGSVQNLRDIATSPYLDLALVQTDGLDEAKRQGFNDVAGSITYIAPLYQEEVQILARGNIATIRDLDGKKVGVDVAGSAPAERASAVFDRLGIKPDMVNLDPASALTLLQHGTIDAVVFADGKPVPALAALPPQDDLHFVAIPYLGTLQDAYFPAQLESQDYPNLIKPGTEVETIAIGTILAAYNAPEGSPRYRKLAKFTQAFFRQFDNFHMPGRHPKWQEVNFAAVAPGWQRFKPAQDWLDQNQNVPTTAAK